MLLMPLAWLNAFPECSKVVEIGCVKAWRGVCVGGQETELEAGESL